MSGSRRMEASNGGARLQATIGSRLQASQEHGTPAIVDSQAADLENAKLQESARLQASRLQASQKCRRQLSVRRQTHK